MPGGSHPAGLPLSARRFVVSPLQRAWLRELGLEQVWTPTGAGAAASAPVADSDPTRRAAPAVRARPVTRVKTAATANTRMLDALCADQTDTVAALDLNALRERVLACEACSLHAGRKQAVFGTGALPASWLIVGEAPGEQEDKQGEPFVGRSGQLLDAMLATVGRSRKNNVYIANVIKCRPPGNRNPRPEEIAACRPYLLRQIALLKPECILVMGRFAAQTLLDTGEAISKLRGRLHTLKTEAGQEIPVVVSYHPAYLLRSPHEKAKAWADLRLAAAR